MEPTRVELVKTVDQVTAGWTDTQIRNYPLDQIEAQIRSAELTIEQLLSTVSEQQTRLEGLRKVLRRKHQLG